MPKRSRTPKDENVTAFEILKAATEQEQPRRKEEALKTLEQLEEIGVKIIPRGLDEAVARGPTPLPDSLGAILPRLKKYWPEILEIMAEQGNPAAVALGRLGGLKGGPARAKKLSKKKRREIAKKAAAKRWGEKVI